MSTTLKLNVTQYIVTDIFGNVIYPDSQSSKADFGSQVTEQLDAENYAKHLAAVNPGKSYVVRRIVPTKKYRMTPSQPTEFGWQDSSYGWVEV